MKKKNKGSKVLLVLVLIGLALGILFLAAPNLDQLGLKERIRNFTKAAPLGNDPSLAEKTRPDFEDAASEVEAEVERAVEVQVEGEGEGEGELAVEDDPAPETNAQPEAAPEPQSELPDTQRAINPTDNERAQYPITSTFSFFEAPNRPTIDFQKKEALSQYNGLFRSRSGSGVKDNRVITALNKSLLMEYKTAGMGRYFIRIKDIQSSELDKIKVYVDGEPIKTKPEFNEIRKDVTYDLLRLGRGFTITIAVSDARTPMSFDGTLLQLPIWYSSGYPDPEPIVMGDRKPLRELDIFKQGGPRFHSFRSDSKGLRGYESAVINGHAKTLGAAPKMWNEELSMSAVNLPIMQRMGEEFPNKLILNHFNANSMKGQFSLKDYFSSAHFRYYAGSSTTANLRANEETIMMEDTSNFLSESSRRIGQKNRRSPEREAKLEGLIYNDVIVIVPVFPNGLKDWKNSEFAVIKEIKPDRLIVSRGHFDTTPKNFRAGSYVAPSMTANGYIGEDDTLFRYNYSADCPKDENGMNCGDAMVKMFSDFFSRGGDGERFHGIMTDIWPWSLGTPNEIIHDTNQIDTEFRLGRNERLVDANVDGIGDNGYDANGVNAFSLGVYDTARKLRKAFGDEFIFTADGNSPSWPRITAFSNGTESEGLSWHSDGDYRRWANNLNIYPYWLERVQAKYPFLTIIPKVKVPEDAPHGEDHYKYTRQRLAWAVCAILEVANAGQDETEFTKGDEMEIGWLGKPVGPIIRPAMSSPDLLRGAGVSLSTSFMNKWSSEQADILKNGNGLTIRHKTKDKGLAYEKMSFALNDITIPEGDLFFQFELMMEPFTYFPADVNRYITVTVDGNKNRPDFSKLRWQYATADRSGYRRVAFYCQSAGPATVTINIEAEGVEPLYIKNFTVHSAQDVLYREFEGGVVLANPSDTPHTFNLDKLFPGQRFKRLKGNDKEDPTNVNDGSKVSGNMELEPLSGIFLVKVR